MSDEVQKVYYKYQTLLIKLIFQTHGNLCSFDQFANRLKFIMTERSLRSSGARQCRICLQRQQIDNVVSPCACRGSIEHVHLSCLQQYFSHRFKSANISQRRLMRQRLQCQICRSQITCLKMESDKRCANIDQLSDKLESEDICFLVVFVLLYIGFHAVGVILLLQESLITKIVGGAWLLLATLSYNFALYRIIVNICYVRETTANVINFP